MTQVAEVIASTLLVECLAGEPTLMTNDKGLPANLKPLPKVYRGAALGLVRSLIDTASTHRIDSVRAIGEPLSSTLGCFGAAIPVLGPGGRTVYGVRLQFGNPADDAPAPLTGAYEWELGLGALPPRLHLTPESLELLDVPEDMQGRAVYGPLDFYSRMAALSDVISMWESVNTAGPDYAAHGSFTLRIPVANGTETLRVLRYAERFHDTPAGPRVRGLLEDITSTVDMSSQRILMMDATTSGQLLCELGVYGLVFDTRLVTAPTVLRWLTPFLPGIGHGVSTGQMPGIHPNDIARIPEMLQRSATGPVQDAVRVRQATGGWMDLRFTATRIDEQAAPHVGVAIIYP